jgi:hypothetical protein
MRRFTILFIYFLLIGKVHADIAPSPIIIKGIYTIDSCKIQMTQEYVYADLYNDSAKVVCTFELLNFGESQTIQVGFPVMNFQYWSYGQYNENDKNNFRIYVDNMMLTENDIGVPAELQSIYNTYMHIYQVEKEYNRKLDSIYTANNFVVKKNGTIHYPSSEAYRAMMAALDDLSKWRDSKPQLDSELWNKFDSQIKIGNFPWYVWNVHFDKDEKKTIKVVYSLPSGEGYGANYRYFKYILETGSGWYGSIEKADIELKLHDIRVKTIEEISPKGYLIDTEEKTIKWNFVNLEPTKNEDIYVRYYNPKERRKWHRYQWRREMAFKLRSINPIN